jgi:hypothetical protein
MRVLSLVSLGAIIAGKARAQSEFEPVDFNATEALLENGIDESLLASLNEKLDDSIVARSTPCALAVSHLLLLPWLSR